MFVCGLVYCIRVSMCSMCVGCVKCMCGCVVCGLPCMQCMSVGSVYVCVWLYMGVVWGHVCADMSRRDE